MQIHAFCKGLFRVLKDNRSLVTKTILVMKLSAILILVTSLHVAARSTAQKVTYSGKQVEIPKVLSAIREQTGYVFFYDKQFMQGISPITVSLKDVPVEQALKTILHDLPLDFEIQGNTIFINRKATITPSLEEVPARPAPLADTLRGMVRDSTGAPLPGASVIIKGTKLGTRTDLKGSFAMPHIRPGSVLVISYTGYEDKEIKVESATSFFITMKRSLDPLDATVVQAYGTTSRRFSVSSIATVNAETIEKQPVTNVLLALAGQVPGLTITATSGVPGSKVLIQVRGQSTVLSDPNGFKPYDQPLFIIDGVPFAPQNANINQLNNLAAANTYNGGISTGGGLSPFNNINPNDIESISILKDADATSIYGTQGSNGVMLITTKKGKPGKTTFNLTANTGYNTSVRTIKLMNTQQYLQLRKDAFAADGLAPSSNPYNYYGYAPDLLIFDQNKYTDWQKTIFGKTSNNTDIHASLSGGTYNNTFLLSAGYTRSDFNIPGDFADQRFSLHTTVHHNSLDGHLTIDFGTDFGYESNNSGAGGAGQRILLPPNTPDLLDAKGNLVWSYKGVDLSTYQFYAYLKQPTELQNYNLNNTLRIAYRILPGLSLSANMGYSRNTTSEKSQFPAAAQSPQYAFLSAQFAANAYETVNIEPQLDYTYNRGKSMFTALLGASYKKNIQNGNTVYASGYANDNFLGSVNGASSVSDYDQFNIYKYSAGFARLKYIYDQKYILSLSGRRDGSSNFGPGNQFGNFGSAGAGWIFSEEKFFKPNVTFISYGKFSGNYGTSGSDGVAAYQYQPFWQPLGYVPAFQGVQPNVPSNLYNPDYSWALKKSLNIAMDLGFFHDRLLFNATWYRMREGSQLGGYPLPAHVGFTSVLQNLPATVQNQGWEFSVSSNNIKTKDFTWNTNFNITFNRNKLLAFPNLEGSTYANQYVLGKPVSVIMGSRFKGLNSTTGLFEYYDKDGHVTNSPNYQLVSQGGDRVPIADREVKYMGGFGNTLTYKHFSLYVFFQFSSQTAPNYMATIYSSYFPGQGKYNLPIQVLNYWKKPGDQAVFQKLTTSYGSAAFSAASNFSSSTGAYSDDTYMRLKTLSLSYSLPDTWLKKMHMRDLRIYANAQNLLTFTNYKVADPEQFNDYTSFPLQRTVVFGLNLNF